MHAWIEYGSQNTDPLVNSVIKEALTSQPVPTIPLTTLLAEHAYLKRTIGKDAGVFLRNYATCVDKGALEEITLEQVPVGFLTDTQTYLSEGWDVFHRCIQDEYLKIPTSEWDEKLKNADHDLKLFFEILEISDFQINTDDYKTALQKFVIQSLQGSIENYVEDVEYDHLFTAIPEKTRGDWCRAIHENITNISQKGLKETSLLTPELLQCIFSQKPVTLKEKDNYVRHLLCNALEVGHASLIDCLLSLKRKDMAAIIKGCDDSTKQRLEQSLTQIMNSSLDDDKKKKLLGIIEGKKSKRYLEETYPSVFKPIKKDEVIVDNEDKHEGE